MWSATKRTITAGQLWPPSALSISATKIGIRTRRPIVSALGSCCNGAETARVAMSLERIRPWPRPSRCPASSTRTAMRSNVPCAAVAAAEQAGITIVLLLAAYGRGGLPRFRQDSVADYLRQVEDLRGRGVSVGLAPHSVRACPADWLEEIGRYATAERLPLHVHADEQPREIEECLAEHGVRPIELPDRTGCLSERTTVVHATHANGDELDLLARAGARICACPTTEANLVCRLLPVKRV